MNVDDAMLMAFIDGELDAVTTRRIEKAAAADQGLATRIAAQRMLKIAVVAHYAPVAREAVPGRFAALLAPTASVESNVVSLPEARARRGRLPFWGAGMAMAASLAIGLVIGQGFDDADGRVAVKGGRLVAQGPLASALDGQLASAQGMNDATRIGLSFRDRQGGYCRSFQDGALAGVACRDGGGWRLEQAVAAGRQDSAYRQASAGDPRIAATVEALIAGDPLDAQAEKAARDGGWMR